MAYILIVEDDSLITKIYSTRLKADGHTVLIAADYNQAEEAIKKEKFDLCLVDLMIPKGNGFEVLNLVKRKNKNIPVLIYSNFSKEEEVKKAKELGADDFLVKAELTPSQVVEKIKKYLPK